MEHEKTPRERELEETIFALTKALRIFLHDLREPLYFVDSGIKKAEYKQDYESMLTWAKKGRKRGFYILDTIHDMVIPKDPIPTISANLNDIIMDALLFAKNGDSITRQLSPIPNIPVQENSMDVCFRMVFELFPKLHQRINTNLSPSLTITSRFNKETSQITITCLDTHLALPQDEARFLRTPFKHEGRVGPEKYDLLAIEKMVNDSGGSFNFSQSKEGALIEITFYQ